MVGTNGLNWQYGQTIKWIFHCCFCLRMLKIESWNFGRRLCFETAFCAVTEKKWRATKAVFVARGNNGDQHYYILLFSLLSSFH